MRSAIQRLVVGIVTFGFCAVQLINPPESLAGGVIFILALVTGTYYMKRTVDVWQRYGRRLRRKLGCQVASFHL